MKFENRAHSDIYQSISRHLMDYDEFLITTHVRSDGDSIASVLIMGRILTSLGKKYTILLDDCIPVKFNFLPGINQIRRYSKAEYSTAYNHVIVVDSSDLNRTGEVSLLIQNADTILNLDHHPSNIKFGTINHVDAVASSTVEVVYPLINELDIPVASELATLVYTGILSDTGRFLFSNTSSNALFLCAEMVKQGASPTHISEMLYRRISPETMHAYAKALSSLCFYQNGQVTSIHLNLKDQVNCQEVDTEGFVDTISGIDGVKASFFMIEKAPDFYHISFRSKGLVDMNQVAYVFGGGGHIRASGCNVRGTFESLTAKILEEIEKRLSGS